MTFLRRVSFKYCTNFNSSFTATPLGQVPILEVDGKVLYQTIPICRFLGSKFNLLGDNEMENYQIDNVVQTITDLRMSEYKFYYYYYCY